MEAQTRWFHENVRANERECMHFVIQSGEVLCGCGGLKNINVAHSTAELFVYLGFGHSGQGLASFAVRALKEKATTLGLRKVYLHVRKDNRAALKLYERTGFEHEAELSREFVWDGAQIDVCRMAWFPRD
jgi:diamine N-acetyltransferase